MDSIRLKNYKAFLDSGDFEFKKINILVGPNSSGKSSFIKSLLTLKNTMNQDESTVLGLNKYIGNFNSVVYKNKRNDRIGYQIKINVKPLLLEKKINSKIDPILFTISNEILSKESKTQDYLPGVMERLIKRSNEYIPQYIEFYVKQNQKNSMLVDEFNINFTNNKQTSIKKERNSYYVNFEGKRIGVANLLKPKRFYFKLNNDKLSGLKVDDLETAYILNTVFNRIEEDLVNFTKKIQHIKPLRNEFDRTEYITNLEKEVLIGAKGENTLQAWLSLKAEKGHSETHRKINRWLDEFDLGTEMKVDLVGQDDYYALKIKNKYTNIWNNILDVGIGTTQLLPIIIEAVLPNSRRTLIVEEPETHVHPKAQSKLAELFVECVKEHNKHFIIETHSIFLITKLQILVAQALIDSNDIGIYYFDQSENGTIMKKMELNKNGQFREVWPSGFFDVQYLLGSEFFDVM